MAGNRRIHNIYIASLCLIIVALLIIFLLGVFLGQIAEISWLRSGIQTLLAAAVTVTLIFLFAKY